MKVMLLQEWSHTGAPPLELRTPLNSEQNSTCTVLYAEYLYGGQFTLSTQLIKPNYLVILSTDAAPQFL